MAKKIESYVDTSALIAFLDHSDSHHPLFAQLFSDPPKLLTSPLVIAEGHAWFLKRYDTSRALQFLDFIEALNTLTVIPTSQKELQKANHFLRKFSDQNLTLTDALGLFLMEQKKIKNCWSTDRHLGLTGVALIIYQT